VVEVAGYAILKFESCVSQRNSIKSPEGKVNGMEVKRSSVVLICSFEHDRTQVWPGDGAMHHSLVSRIAISKEAIVA
jgi:hypothetical protein